MAPDNSLFVGEGDSDNSPIIRHLFRQQSDSSPSTHNASEAGSAYDPDDMGIKEEAIEEDEDPTALHCVCRTQASGQMIACDGPCGIWFHAPCLSLRGPDIKAINEFFCKSCTADGHGPTTWLGTVQQAKNVEERVKKQMAGKEAVGQLNDFATRSTNNAHTTKRAGRVVKRVGRAAPVEDRRHHRVRRERVTTPRASTTTSSRQRLNPLPSGISRSHLDSTNALNSGSETRITSPAILAAAAAAGTVSPSRDKRQSKARKHQTRLSPIVYSLDGQDVSRPGMKYGSAEGGGGEAMDVDGGGHKDGMHVKKLSFVEVLVKEAMEMALFGVISVVEEE